MLRELAGLSDDQEHCQVIFAVLEYRIRSPEHKWRCVYKALQVLEYLLQRGSLHCCTAAQELVVAMAALQNFTYVGPDQKDYGLNVRLRAEAVKSLILDPTGLAQKRVQLTARAANLKFGGFSREELMAAPAGGGAATRCAMGRSESPPGLPVTPTPGALGPGGGVNASAVASIAPASLESPSDGPLSPSGYRPPSFFAVTPAARTGQQPSSSIRNAGETKGVTFEQNKRQLEQLRQLTLREGNRICADCASTVAAACPTWASINLGVFICMRCAGIHRGLGVHISKVRSTSLDTWLPDQVATMARLGNRMANAHFEAGLDPALRPAPDNTLELERFIRLKYADRVWAAKGPWPPEDDTPVAPVSVTATPGAAVQAISVCGKQVNGAALRSPSPPPPLPASTLPDAGPAVWPSSWPPAASGSGGGFGDAPPTWPSPTSSLTPPSSSQPLRMQQPSAAAPPAARLALVTPAPGARKGTGGLPIRLLPPPPPSGTTGSGLRLGAGIAASAAGPAPGREGGGVMSGSSTDLLQLDSDSDDDVEEGSAGGCGGGCANTRDGATGGPHTAGATALWDLLDPTLDVMTWLDRVESAQQPPRPLQAQPLQPPLSLEKQPSHQQVPSGPVFGNLPATGAVASAPAIYPCVGAPSSEPMTAMSLGARGTSESSGAPATGRAAAAGTTPAGVPAQRLGEAESVILTAEFPVYDLLTPLPTGGGGAPLAVAAGGDRHSAGGRHYATPPTQPIPHAYPQVHPSTFISGPHSAPALRPHSGVAQPFSGVGGGGPVSVPSRVLAATTATSTAAATPPGTGPALQRNSTGVRTGGMTRGGGGMGMRGAAVQAAPAAAGPGPALDLDNLLAMQLDSLGKSLAGGPSGNVGAGGGGRPSWQPADAVGSAFGGVGAARR